MELVRAPVRKLPYEENGWRTCSYFVKFFLAMSNDMNFLPCSCSQYFLNWLLGMPGAGQKRAVKRTRLGVSLKAERYVDCIAKRKWQRLNENERRAGRSGCSEEGLTTMCQKSNNVPPTFGSHFYTHSEAQKCGLDDS